MLALASSGSPNPAVARSEIASPDDVPTPPRLKDFVIAMRSMSPVLTGKPGKSVLRPNAEFDPRVLMGFFSRDGVSFTGTVGRSLGRVSLARLSSELAAKKGRAFRLLLTVSYSLGFFYEKDAPTMVRRDGRLLKMEVHPQFVISFVMQDGLYVVSSILVTDDDGDL